jgi:putative oxidoreductase
MERLLQTSASSGPFFARVALAAVMFPHGAQKVLGWFGGPGWDGAIEGFGHLGVPAVLGALVMLAEFVGAIGLFVGLFTRVAAAGIVADMVGAIVLVHGKNGFFMNWGGDRAGEGFEYHLLAIGVALLLVVEGAGALSIDRLLTLQFAHNRELRPRVLPPEHT